MSARIPARRLALSLRPRPAPAPAPASAAARWAGLRRASTEPDLSNPLLEKYLQQRDAEHAAQPDARPAAPRPPAATLRDGGSFTVPSPLFDPADRAALDAHAQQRRAAVEREREKRLLSSTIDPDPPARRSLERRLVIKGVAKHGRTTKAARLLRTERSSLYKSHFLPTSVKKTTKILNQITGKTVSEALVQLRFSPKKIARDIYKGLLIAQDEAIAARGMGLGDRRALARWTQQRDEVASTLASLDAGTPRPKAPPPQLIELKHGRTKLVRDPTEIYIDQAWCGRGQSWGSPEFRARGRVNMLTHRTTSFSFLLKEEKTRIRISDEIKKKRHNRKLWLPLPDRPVSAQRQYCLW